MTPIALTIAGSDSGGCAGIQADLKTFSALGVFGTSALTALTAQNTQGVRAVEILSPDFVGAQIEAVLDDMAVGAAKVGMAGNAETIARIADVLAGRGLPLVVDPVMVATSGDRLLANEAVAALMSRLLPLAILVTPNLAEAAILTGRPAATNEAEMRHQGEAILAAGSRGVLVKGGHLAGDEAVDLLLLADGTFQRLATPKVATTSDHGTGCTLSAAIAAGLAKGMALGEAVPFAKDYLTRALQAANRIEVGKGRGPVHHFHAWW